MLTTPKDFLIRTCSCLRHYEYMSKTDALIKSSKSTAQIVWESRTIDIKNVENFNNIEEVAALLDWVNSLSSTNYDSLLKTVCNKPLITETDMAVLCSAVVTYRKMLHYKAMNTRIASMVTNNEWPYSIGDIITGEGQIIYVDDSIRFKKKSWCVRLADCSGVMLVYYTNANPNYKPNQLISYNGKVKAWGMTTEHVKYTHIVC